MKTKAVFAITIAVAILSIITLPAMAWPSHYPSDDQPCVCDHWSESQCPGYYDIFTSAAVDAHYSASNNYQYADLIFRAAYGGRYTFYNPNQNPATCYYYYGGIPHPNNPDTSLLYGGTYYKWDSTYPVSITWNGQTYNYYTTRDMTIHVTYQPLNTSYAQTQQWFHDEYQGNPWLCGIQWAYCYTSS